jgi:putative ABC transport system substrate-binding protein
MTRFKRRDLILGMVALTVAPSASAQLWPAAGDYSIGVLAYATQADFRPQLRPFIEGLRDAGLVEGRNLRIEYRFADYDQHKIGRLAGELVRAGVQLIYAPQPWAVRGAQSATKSIPIVFSAVNDPVGAEFVQSLARPGGNITGISIASADLTAKRVQLMREMFPAAQRFAIMYDKDAAQACQIELTDIRQASRSLAVDVLEYPYHSRGELPRAFERAQSARIAAALVPTTYETRRFGSTLQAESSASHIPVIHASSGPVEAGGLMSYGPSEAWAARRAADYVVKILKGARPADLPIEQPTSYELIINMKTARTMGIRIPPSILVRADRVIE